MKITLGELRQAILPLLREATDEWSVRSGENLLVRRESDGPKDWRWHVSRKVQYFSSADIVMSPRSPQDRQVWTFRRPDGWLVAVDENQFFSRPEWKYSKRF